MISASAKSLPKKVALSEQIREIELQIIQRKRIVTAARNGRLTRKADNLEIRVQCFEAILRSLQSLQPGNPARTESEN